MAIARKPKSAPATPAPEKPAEVVKAKAPEAVETPVPVLVAPVLEKAAAAAKDYASNFQSLLKQNAEKAMAEAQTAQDRLRLAAEQSLEPTRTAYEKIKSAAEETTASLETSYAATTRGLTELNQKTFSLLKAHAEANFEHVKAVMSAKSMPEVIDLQTTHLKKSFESANEQLKELASTVKKVATDAGEPIKAAFGKRFAA